MMTNGATVKDARELGTARRACDDSRCTQVSRPKGLTGTATVDKNAVALKDPSPCGSRRRKENPHMADPGALRGLTLSLVLAWPVFAQSELDATPLSLQLTAESCPRVVDPKLSGAAVDVSYVLAPVSAPFMTTITLRQGGCVVTTLWSGCEFAGDGPCVHAWNGRDAAGAYVPPGAYTVHVECVPHGSPQVLTVDYPLDVVRLGIRAMAWSGPKEWQMVYFKMGALYAFFATPALHEYFATADAGDLADLDLNSGMPRPAPAPHAGLASPPLEGANYEDDNYNFPLCYVAGSTPTLTVTFGSACTNGSAAVAAGYPLLGMPIRCHADESNGTRWTGIADIAIPGGTAEYRGPPQRLDVGRQELAIRWSWEYSPDGGATWAPIPGYFDTQHRVYTILGAPRFASGASGSQYAGPWVEVVDDLHVWRSALGIDTSNAHGVVEALIKGFAGQIGPLPTAIEGVLYDTNVLGGDGGASHYYVGSVVQLSRLLDAHSNGVFVNCSDCAASTATMLSMLGVANVQLQRLGSMTLRAIRGIGAPSYTLLLWGSAFPHGFSYHHIITRNGGAEVSDACLWVDEDGNPNALPGLPGYNVDRPWNAPQIGYMGLAAANQVTFTLEAIPGLQ